MRRLWIDTDAGVDDAQAILLALANNEVEIVGISTVHGNANSHQVALNVLRILKVADSLDDIPVYEGCDRALLGGQGDSSNYHGKDGLGDVPDPDAPKADVIKKGHGVHALLDAVAKNPGDITLVTLGPLTNIAMAIRLDPCFGKNLKECFIMGGNYEAKGNITMCAEFNFHTDPEAAYVVLNDLQTRITMACWELCLKHSLPWKWYTEEYVAIPTRKGRFISAIDKVSLSIYYSTKNKEELGYETADQLLMAFIVKPELIRHSREIYCDVELSGPVTRGQMSTYKDLRSTTSPTSEFLATIEAYMHKSCLDLEWNTWIPCDELAMVAAMYENIIRKSVSLAATVELYGKHSRGQMIPDWGHKMSKEANITIIMELDTEMYVKHLRALVDNKS